MTRSTPVFLTDELERQLALAAYDDQFRLRPISSVMSAAKRLIASLRTRMSSADSLATRSV